MAGTNLSLIANLEHQFELLLEQLKHLEDCRCEVSGEEFELLQEHVVYQMKRFSQILDQMQMGDTAMDNKLSKLREDYRKLVNASFSLEELFKYFGAQGATKLGLQLMQLEEDFKLRKVDSDIYVKQKVEILEALQSRGGKLSEEHSVFLANMN